MANTYSAGGSRTTAVFVGIVILHLIFFWALKQGLVRAGLQIVQDFSIMDLPPPPPPPEDLDEPPPPPPVDVPPPVVPPPLIDLPAFEGPSTAITAKVQETPRAQPQAAARQVQVTPPRIKARGDRVSAAICRLLPVRVAPPERRRSRGRHDHHWRRWQGGRILGFAEQRFSATRRGSGMRAAPPAVRSRQARRPAGRRAGDAADPVQAGVRRQELSGTGQAQVRGERRRLSGKCIQLEGLQNG